MAAHVQHFVTFNHPVYLGSSHFGAVETHATTIHKDVASVPGLTQWVGDPMLLWLWLWPRLEATAPI